MLTVGSLDGQHANALIEIPGLLSFLATGDFNGPVQGIDELKAQYAQTYGATGNPLVADVATNYVPNIPTTYWSFRLMIGVGMAAAMIALAVLWLTRQGRTPTHRWGSCGPPWPLRSCRCSATRSAGSSPRSAGSRGSSSG